MKQEERNKRKDEIMTKADLGVDEEAKLKRMNVIRQLYTTILEKKMTDDEEVRRISHATPSCAFRRLGPPPPLWRQLF